MKKWSKLLTISLLLGTMSMSLIGCGSSTKTSNANKANKDGYIRLGSSTDLTTFDPHKMNDTSTAPAIRSIYETLVRLNPKTNKFEPYLAESYEYVKGSNKDIKFKLHKGVKFHNGDVLTAEDVKFSLDRQHKSGNVGHLVAMIKDVEVLDDLTFIIHLKEPSSAILSSLSHMGCSILNKKVVSGMDKEGKSLDKNPVGTGPFMFENWTLGSEWTIKKNADYWNDKFKAQSEGLTCKIIPEDTSRTVAIQADEIDVLLNVSNVDIENIRKDKNIKLEEFQTTSLEFVGLNCSKAPFNNKALREAVAYCINRKDIAQVQFNGEATPCYTCIGPAALGYTPDVEKHEYSIEKAKEKLKEAGKPNGFTFTISTIGETKSRACQVIQAACKKAGIEVKIETLEKSAYNDKIGHGDHEAAYTGWTANAEPDNTYRPLFSSSTAGKGGSNSACYKNKEIDKLIDEGSKASDDKVKLEKYQQVAKIIAKECAVIPTCSQKGLVAMRKNVDGMNISPILMHDYFGLHIVK